MDLAFPHTHTLGLITSFRDERPLRCTCSKECMSNRRLDVLAFSLRGRNIAIRPLITIRDTVVGCRRWWKKVWVFCGRGVA